VKRACIDTHAVVWHASRPRRLGSAASRWLRDADRGRAEILIPAIVPVELSLVRESGRRIIGPVELDALIATQPAFRILPLDLRQATEFALLSSIADPFDRLMVAAARVAEAPLITADGHLHACALVETIWD
jgi:PIN domain nuclease of toxin-antitoxin system